jgi:hypothetical protein
LIAWLRSQRSSWYGPVPFSLVANHSSPLVSIDSEDVIANFGRTPRKNRSGPLRVISTVLGSTAAIVSTLPISVAGPWLTVRIRSSDAATSSASSSEPSWNVTPERILNVYVKPSSETSHDSASAGRSSVLAGAYSSSPS